MGDPPTPPYTEATVELVADAVAQATLAPAIGGTRRHARLVLDALVKAGLLLPEGAETRTEYVVKIRRSDGSSRVIESPQLPTEELAHGVAAEPNWSPEVRREVVRRRVFDEVIATYPDTATTAEGGGEADQLSRSDDAEVTSKSAPILNLPDTSENE